MVQPAPITAQPIAAAPSRLWVVVFREDFRREFLENFLDFRAALLCAAILVLIRLASRTVSLSPPSKCRWSRSGNSISQRVGASLRRLLVKCGLSSGGSGATRQRRPILRKSPQKYGLSPIC